MLVSLINFAYQKKVTSVGLLFDAYFWYELVIYLYNVIRSNTGNVLNFDYVIVIDFESTCWDTKDKQSKWQNLAEIIEFPAVLLNLRTGKIEDEFHQYVMPVENPKLSEFCINLTGKMFENFSVELVLIIFNFLIAFYFKVDMEW